jgi:hypothetical protein
MRVAYQWGGGTSFAEIRFAFWGDAVFTPGYWVVAPENASDYQWGNADGETYSGVATGPEWGGYAPRLQFGAYGNDPDERYGFMLEIHADWWWDKLLKEDTGDGTVGNDGSSANGVALGDNANLWIKPFDFLTLKVGKYTEDALRGTIGHLDFPNLVSLGPEWRFADGKLLSVFDGDEDTIFTRFQADRGAHIALEFGSLYIGASVGDSNKSDPQKDGLVDAYSQIQAGVGYTIENIGFARAQFVGGHTKWDDKTDTAISKAVSGLNPTYMTPYNRIEAAFALTSLPVGTIDIGAKIPLSYKSAENAGKDVIVQAPFGVSAAANLLLGPIDLLARIDSTFAGSTKLDGEVTREDGFTLVIAAEPSFKIGQTGITIGADVEFFIAGNSKSDVGGDLEENKDGANLLGLGLWVGKAIGAANIRTGVLAQVPAGHNWDGDETRSTRIAIPVQFSFSL